MSWWQAAISREQACIAFPAGRHGMWSAGQVIPGGGHSCCHSLAKCTVRCSHHQGGTTLSQVCSSFFCQSVRGRCASEEARWRLPLALAPPAGEGQEDWAGRSRTPGGATLEVLGRWRTGAALPQPCTTASNFQRPVPQPAHPSACGGGPPAGSCNPRRCCRCRRGGGTTARMSRPPVPHWGRQRRRAGGRRSGTCRA